MVRYSEAEYAAYEANRHGKHLAQLRKRGVLPPEPPPAPSKADVAQERELHDQFIAWAATKRGTAEQVALNYSRMDRKSTMREGWPDFSVHKNGRCCFIEFKLPANGLTAAQAAIESELRHQCGCHYAVCYSLAEAIEFTRKELLE